MPFNSNTYKDQLSQLVALPSVSCAIPKWDMGIGRINTPSSSKSTIKNRLLAIATLLSAH
jgi:hypothetical protein